MSRRGDDDTYDLSSDPPPPVPRPRVRANPQHLQQQAAMYPPPAFTGRGDYAAPPAPSGSGGRRRAGLIGAAVSFGVVAVIVGMVVFARVSREKSAPVPFVVDRASFVERPAMRRLQRGVRFCEVSLRGKGPGQGMRVWVYLPEGTHAPKSLPCVFVAPAGSTLITGMDLSAEDRPEHLPYVAEGFAVVSYEIDGAIPGDIKRANDTQISNAVKKFIRAEAGISNAKTAIEYTLSKVPEVDPNRLYCAGHSSAATLALQLAASEPRIKGTVAYAPCTNIAARLGSQFGKDVERYVPGAKEFMRKYSPINMPPKGPVFLFHARDDSVVPAEESRLYAAENGERVKFVTVADGDHHASMMIEGIPQGIEWLRKQAGVATPAKKTRRRDTPPAGDVAAEPAAEPEPEKPTEPETEPAAEPAESDAADPTGPADTADPDAEE